MLRQVIFVAQDDRQPAPGRITRNACAVDAAADDQHICRQNHGAIHLGVKYQAECFAEQSFKRVARTLPGFTGAGLVIPQNLRARVDLKIFLHKDIR